MSRDFNAAIAKYCLLLHLPPSLIENVTDGTNAYLIALDGNNHILGSEAKIVAANRRHHIKDIYLLDRPLREAELEWSQSAPLDELTDFFERRSPTLTPNPCLLDRIAEADVIIYAPGTQHSSLFPSYLTPGLGAAIAQNLSAIKLLITNLQEDVEIPDSSAVDIINKAAYYLKAKDRFHIPTPCLITNYLLNDPGAQRMTHPTCHLGDSRILKMSVWSESRTMKRATQGITMPPNSSPLLRSRFSTAAVPQTLLCYF